MNEYTAGEHIYVWRTRTLQGVPIPPYQHHGILVSEDTVISYTGEPFWVDAKDARVSCVPLAEFTRGGRVQVRGHKDGFASAQVVSRAESRLGETNYGLLTRNCEHLANWCATGQWRSRQIETGQMLLVAAVLGVGPARLGPALRALGAHGHGGSA
jgi:hypothetical protein